MCALRATVIGGGPAGLFLARLLKLTDPAATVDVYERNGPDYASGLGIVLSDRTMSSLRAADAETHDLIRKSSGAWADVELRFPSETIRYAGYGFTAISRPVLLRMLQQQADRVGVRMHFHRAATIAEFSDHGSAGPDVIVVADGARSRNRKIVSEQLGTKVESGRARYIWFGTTASFDALTHAFAMTDYGPFAGHAHPYGAMDSFVVQTDEATWLAAGMDAAAKGLRRDETDEYARKLLTEVFAEHLGGQPLVGKGSQWRNFAVVDNDRWSAGNVVLLGDAAHTAHFSVGSGTKMAMEDAVELAAALRDSGTIAEAYAAYERARRPAVARTTHWGRRSMRWWETFGRRLEMPPRRFALHFITRTGSLSHAGLRGRHPERIDEVEADFVAEHVPAGQEKRFSHAIDVPYRLGAAQLRNRVVTVLQGGLEEQLATAGAFGAAGGGLVLADWRAASWDDQLGRWSAAARETKKFGAVFGVLTDSATLAKGAFPAAVAAEAQVIEVVLDAEVGSHTEALDLVGADEQVALCVGLRCPAGDAWSPEADSLVDQCGELRARRVAAVHLHGTWEQLADFADRIRTETGLPVIVDGPDGWALGGRADGAADDWATVLHLALVSGRLDLVAAWPLSRPRINAVDDASPVGG